MMAVMMKSKKLDFMGWIAFAFALAIEWGIILGHGAFRLFTADAPCRFSFSLSFLVHTYLVDNTSFTYCQISGRFDMLA